jgi:hypothetical protein
MMEFLERSADGLARRLLEWLHGRVDPGSREWLDALTADLECADDGWQRLRWALGGVPLVWTINRRRRVTGPARGAMPALIVAGVANFVAIAGLYAVIIPGTYAATRFYGCRLVMGNDPGGCQEHPFVFGAIAIGSAVLGVIIALALRARFAANWWAVFSVFNTVGFVWYLSSGIVDLPRYGATQSAMLLAATFGVVVAAIARHILETDGDHGPSHPVADSGGAPALFVSRRRITLHLIAGVISFALADVLIRMRASQPVVDNVNHFAILASAMFAAMLAGLIARHDSRRSARELSLDSDLQPTITT